jgi:ornithine carbamoyltransferase
MNDDGTNNPGLTSDRATEAPLEIVFNRDLKNRDLLSDTDLTPDEIFDLLDTGAVLKQLRRRGVPHLWLPGKTLGMIFQHPSTRTRAAFQAGMQQLGGRAIFLGVNDMQLRRGETVFDTGVIMSRYVDAIAARVADKSDLNELADGSTVPVFNGLTSFDHPIEALSDLLTLRERFGGFRGLKFAYLGDGNNVCHSLLLAFSAAGVSVSLAGPVDYRPDPQIVETAKRLAAASGAVLTITDDAQEAVTGADAIYTDVHESMGESVNPGKMMALAPYRVTTKLMGLAKPEAVFMHCLPLHRGQEVEAEVADGPHSLLFEQAENRRHMPKAGLLQVLHDERRIPAEAYAKSVA